MIENNNIENHTPYIHDPDHRVEVLALDMDETLLRSDGTIAPQTLTLIRQVYGSALKSVECPENQAGIGAAKTE